MNWIVTIFLQLSCVAEECMAPLGKRSGKNTERRMWLLLPGPVTYSMVRHFVCHPLFKVVHLLQLCISHQAAVHRDTVKKSSETLEPSLRAPCIAVPPAPLELLLTFLLEITSECNVRRGGASQPFSSGFAFTVFCAHSAGCKRGSFYKKLPVRFRAGKDE